MTGMLRKKSSIIVKANINVSKVNHKILICEGFVFLSQEDGNENGGDSRPEAKHLSHSSDAGCT
jgi:hypothetical protein